LTYTRTRYCIFILPFLALFSIYAKANASSLEIRAGGQAHYKADFGGQSNIVPLSSNQKTSYFMAAKWGLGVHLDLNREVSVGIEAATALSAPAFDMQVLNTSTGQVENRRLHNDANLSGITLVLCFPFGE
jgi:hypothetical protein